MKELYDFGSTERPAAKVISRVRPAGGGVGQETPSGA